jgi:anaerobic ribonucleoside-triphosphate reductase activating protein
MVAAKSSKGFFQRRAVLGPGKRVGLWFQGCTIRCKGCMSVHTWEFKKEYLVDVHEIIGKINAFPSDKLTVSGGEPFDQPEALMEILKGVRKTKKDILVYTGYPYEKVRRIWKDILEFIDILITGPFKEGEESELVWKGSENQRMVILNKKLKPLYLEFMKEKKSKTIQLVKSNGSLYLLGIPYQKDWQEFIKTLA